MVSARTCKEKENVKWKTEIYRLDGDICPTIPVPHDGVIKAIESDGDWLIFTFEDDASYHDFIAYCHPGAQTIVMKIHLTEKSDAGVYAQEIRKYETVYVERKFKWLYNWPKKNNQVQYLFHYVGYRAIQIELCADCLCLLELQADIVEIDWMER